MLGSRYSARLEQQMISVCIYKTKGKAKEFCIKGPREQTLCSWGGET